MRVNVVVERSRRKWMNNVPDFLRGGDLTEGEEDEIAYDRNEMQCMVCEGAC